MPKALRAAITGLGVAVPARTLTNADLEKMVDTSDEWITQRTGIKERRIVAADQSTASLAAQAARAALTEAGVAATDLDLILCATITPDMVFPATACFVHQELGARDIPAFDLSAACSGFIYGMAVADGFIRSGKYRRILVIGSESLSRFTDYTDRTSCILFGDGAGAAVLEPAEDKNRGLLYSVLCADGAGWDYIYVPAGAARTPATHQTVDAHEHFIKMRGRDVYKFAVEKMQWLLGDCMAHCHLNPGDIDMVIPHQVNLRIITSAAEKFGLPMEKVYINIDRYGNTSAASVAVGLHEARVSGRYKPGDLVMLLAFGAGLTWGSILMRM
jgi:3-oxoacyl-[acyl-carrier-protein] synthase-3